MSGGIQVLNPLTKEKHLPADVNPDALKHMENMQGRINSYLPQNDQTQLPSRKVFSPETVAKTANLLDQICIETGHKPLSLRLVDLHARISELAEKHLFANQQKELVEKEKMKGNIEDQKSWKGWLSANHAGGGAGTLLLFIASAAIANYSPPISEALRTLGGQLVGSTTQTLTTLIEGQTLPLAQELQLSNSEFQPNKQSVEGLKNVLHQLLQLALEVEREEKQNFATIAQQR